MVCSSSPTISFSRRGSTRGEADSTVVWVGGEQDVATRRGLARTVARAARADRAPVVVVDLSAVTFMDASIVGALVASRDQLRARAQSLQLRAPSPRALRVLQLCGLVDLVQATTVRTAGLAPALSTWVDVPPLEAGPATSPVHALAATVEADRAEP